jgi:hypothetical protein
MQDATYAQLEFLANGLPRFEVCGALDRAHKSRYVLRMFLVPKPVANQWRVIIDLRKLNSYFSDFNMTCETLKHVRHLFPPRDYFAFLDLADGYYTLRNDY